jgi:hypothetical protein
MLAVVMVLSMLQVEDVAVSMYRMYGRAVRVLWTVAMQVIPKILRLSRRMMDLSAIVMEAISGIKYSRTVGPRLVIRD